MRLPSNTRAGWKGPFEGLRCMAAAMVLAGLQLLSSVAWAEEAPVEEGEEVVTEREFETPKLTAGEVLTAPLRLPEYLLRVVLYPARPITAWVTRNHIPERTVDLLSDDTRRIWVLPLAGYDSTNGFHVGGVFRYDDMFYEKKDLYLSGLLYANLDRRFATSFTKGATSSSPAFFKASAGYGLDTDSDYYGTGAASRRGDKSVFTLEKASYTMKAGVKLYPVEELSLYGRLGILWSETSSGDEDAGRPQVTDTFDGSSLMGYGESTTLLRFGATVEYDSRWPGGHSHRGGLLKLSVDRFEDPDGEHSYWELTSRAQMLIDLYRELNVLAIGMRFHSLLGDGEAPFYRLPALDVKNGLRGFPGGRYRDRRTLAGSVEYRFPIWKNVKDDPIFGLGVLFVDLGKPFDDVDSLGEDGVLYSVGTGFQLTTKNKFVARAQIAYGGEGIETVLSIGAYL